MVILWVSLLLQNYELFFNSSFKKLSYSLPKYILEPGF